MYFTTKKHNLLKKKDGASSISKEATTNCTTPIPQTRRISQKSMPFEGGRRVWVLGNVS